MNKDVPQCNWHCCQNPRMRGSYLCRHHHNLEGRWGRDKHFVNMNDVREDAQQKIDKRIAGE